MENEKGVFTVSLDTELCWGMFDRQDVSRNTEQYLTAPEVISDICGLFGEYDVSATWAVVGHLFDDCNGEHPGISEVDSVWVQDWYSKMPCNNDVEKDIWYAPQILKSIESCSEEQEIGLHGYSHLVLGNENCPREAANYEVRKSIEVLEGYGISPDSFVFPRNQIGHRDVLSQHGLEVYRGVDARWYESVELPSPAVKAMRYADEALKLTPPSVTPRNVDGMVEVPGSQVFRPNHGGWQHTPYNSQVKRATKGLDRASRKGEIFHLWLHPFNLSMEAEGLLPLLEKILSYYIKLRRNNQMDHLTMCEIKNEYTRGRWS